MRLARPRPAFQDAFLAVATATLMELSVRVSYGLGAPRPTLSTYLLAASVAVPLLARHRWPLRVLLACSALLFNFYFWHGPAGIAPTIPLGVALYAAAAAGKLRWALLVSTFFVVAGYWALTVLQRQPSLKVASQVVVEAALLGGISLLGDTVHSRRGWAAETQRRIRQAELEREREADRRVIQERLRIARELHDVLAHSISALTIQARVIADGLPDPPPEIRAATDAILSTSREAMADVRATVGLLRETGELPSNGELRAGRELRESSELIGTGVSPPAPGVARVETVLEIARSSGLTAHCAVLGEVVPLPAAVDLTAYRIVQEAVTNVVRHARASTVTVTVEHRPGLLEVRVDDDGRGVGPGGPPGGPAFGGPGGPPGYGLRGMRERAASVGGEVRAGPGPERGFQVVARLPVPE